MKVTLSNCVGVIDSDYTGELRVGMVNLSQEAYTIQPGERIAQLVVARFERIEWEAADSLTPTDRGEGGFGSTGRK